MQRGAEQFLNRALPLKKKSRGHFASCSKPGKNSRRALVLILDDWPGSITELEVLEVGLACFMTFFSSRVRSVRPALP